MKQPQQKSDDKRFVSVFDLAADFFDGCRLLPSLSSSLSDYADKSLAADIEEEEENENRDVENLIISGTAGNRWSCNACKVEFESLLEQRTHFKSDFHRFNVNKSNSLYFYLIIQFFRNVIFQIL